MLPRSLPRSYDRLPPGTREPFIFLDTSRARRLIFSLGEKVLLTWHARCPGHSIAEAAVSNPSFAISLHVCGPTHATTVTRVGEEGASSLARAFNCHGRTRLNLLPEDSSPRLRGLPPQSYQSYQIRKDRSRKARRRKRERINVYYIPNLSSN